MKARKEAPIDDWEPVKPRTGATFVNFGKESSGFSLEGIYKGKETGNFGMNVVLETESAGVVKFLYSIGMQDLDEVKPGDKIRIVYEGKKNTKDGLRSFNAFTVLKPRG